MVRLGFLLAVLSSCSYSPSRTGGSPGDDAPTVNGDAPQLDAPEGAWLDPWLFRKGFSILGSQVAAPGVSSFPVVISIDDADLEARALANGNDIVFTAGDAMTVLDSEIESYAQGVLVAWVRIPTLPSGTDTPLYMYYGNATPPARNPSADVWANEFVGVWHLQQSPNGGNNEMEDSAGNRDGSAQNTMGAGNSALAQCGRGLIFDGNDDTIDVGTTDLTNTFTVSAWVNVDNGTGIRTVFANGGPGGNTDGIRFFINDPGTANKRILVETGSGSGGALLRTNTSAITPAVFHHLAIVVDRGAGSGKIFVDGADVTVDAAVLTNFAVNTDFEIGSLKNDTQAGMTGMLDEFVIARTLRPPEWLRTVFNNQGSPSTFFSAFGAEQQK
jgi:hypothetical protein